jgi:hypothetical protein
MVVSMNKDEALKLALETLEYAGPSWIDARQPAITAIKEALAQPEQEPVAFVQGCNRGQWEIFPAKAYQIFENEQPLYTTPPQRTWVGLTPACPSGLTQYECEVEGVDLVCFLEYTPDEEGSRDSYGLLNEPGTSENLELVNAYVKGTDVDIGHLLLQYLVDHITTTALEDFKNDDY